MIADVMPDYLCHAQFPLSRYRCLVGDGIEKGALCLYPKQKHNAAPGAFIYMHFRKMWRHCGLRLTEIISVEVLVDHFVK